MWRDTTTLVNVYSHIHSISQVSTLRTGGTQAIRATGRESPSQTLKASRGSGTAAARLGPWPTRPDRCRLEFSAELPDRLKQLRVGGIPEAAPMKIGAELPDGGEEVPDPHLRDDLG